MSSPVSTVTTFSTSTSSPAASRISAKSSKSNRSRNRKTSKSMKSLSMRAESPPLKTPDGPPKIVLKNKLGSGTEPYLDAETTFDYLNCNWTNKDHLQVLYKDKDGSLSKTEFAAMDLGDQLHEVIDMHTPSKLKSDIRANL